MTLTTLTGIEQPGRIIHRSHLLVRVIAWELRRLRASHLLWLQALGFFALSLFLTWAGQFPLTLNHMKGPLFLYGFVAGTSAWGLFMNLSTGPLMLLGMLLPFVNADGVTRDRSRRTHELLLATALPTWVYVWGRYLAGLLLSLGLSLLMLTALLGMGWLWHLTVPNYPMPQISNLLVIWVGIIASATIVVGSLSFALGTVLPRLTMLVKIVIMAAWFLGSQLPSTMFGDASHAANFSLPAWYINWDPTSEGISLGLFHLYMTVFSNLATATSAAQNQNDILAAENSLINLGDWFAPHLLLAVFSLLLVLIAALVFKRSRFTLR